MLGFGIAGLGLQGAGPSFRHVNALRFWILGRAAWSLGVGDSWGLEGIGGSPRKNGVLGYMLQG